MAFPTGRKHHLLRSPPRGKRREVFLPGRVSPAVGSFSPQLCRPPPSLQSWGMGEPKCQLCPERYRTTPAPPQIHDLAAFVSRAASVRPGVPEPNSHRRIQPASLPLAPGILAPRGVEGPPQACSASGTSSFGGGGSSSYPAEGGRQRRPLTRRQRLLLRGRPRRPPEPSSAAA